MKIFYYIIPIACIFSGCTEVSDTASSPDTAPATAPASDQSAGQVTAMVKPKSRPETLPQTTVTAVSPPQKAATPEDLDTTTKKERAEAVNAAKSAGGERLLGKTITSLGSPTDPGLWMKTPLVRKASKGRVENPATGDTVSVDLIPLKGPKTAGSQLSLAAFRLIKAPLTDLPELTVYGP